MKQRTFNQTTNSWLMLDCADPPEGWTIDEIIQKAPPAKNDIYGSLFFYLQDVLGRFCNRIGRLKVSIQLFQVDPRKLPSIAGRDEVGQFSFDWIEVRFPRLILTSCTDLVAEMMVRECTSQKRRFLITSLEHPNLNLGITTSQLSNITGRRYLGPEVTLASFSPLLKRKTENLNATIVGLFLNAVHKLYSCLDYLGSIRSDLERLRSYIPMTRNMIQESNRSNADSVRFLSAQLLFRDFDESFNWFKCECR